MIRRTRQAIEPILGIEGEPNLSRVTRWIDSQPQYNVGHEDLVKEIDRLLPRNVYLLGTSYRGVGIPDCLSQARAAVEDLAEIL